MTENEELIPLSYATVQLLLEQDSSFVAGTSTDEEGEFVFASVSKGKYFLLVSSIGYENIVNSVLVNGNIPVLNIEPIHLHESAVMLAEASVVAQRREMVVKNDTVEYDAGAYRLRENAVVEDLLKRLPGISIDEDGKIFVNGKEVTKVMVDGQDFFRSDPNLSIKNIPAHIMDKLQIIEDKSELSKLTGIDDGEENLVINIGIQKDKKRGWLSSNNVGLGRETVDYTGNPMRYAVNSFAARLLEEKQIGIVVNGNNINDMVLGASNTAGSGKPGLNSSLSAGVNFSMGKEKKSPWIINADLSYGQKESIVNRNAFRQYYLMDSTSYQTDTVTNIVRSREIRFSGKVENRSMDRWILSFRPSASFNITNRENIGYSVLQAGNLERDSVNKNQHHSSSSTPSINVSGVFTATHRFQKPRRRASISLSSQYRMSDGEGTTNAHYHYYRRKNNKEVLRDQQWYTQSTTFNNRLYASYIEPIFKKSSLQFVYWIRANERLNLKNNFIPDSTGEYTVLDLPYSKSIENLTLTQQLSVSYRGVGPKLSYVFGIDYNPSRIRSHSFIQNASVDGSDSTIIYFPGIENFNFSPIGYLIYNFGGGKNFRFDYRGRSVSPTVAQIDPSRDESNPNYIRVGNPDLMPKFTHWSRLRYNDNDREKKQSIMVNVEGNYILNDIINFTDFDAETGIKTVSPVNQSGSWNANMVFLFNRPLSNNFQINNYTRSGIRNDIGFSTVNSSTGSEKTIATIVSLNQELGLTYKWHWLYMIGKFKYDLSNTTYSNKNILDKHIQSTGGFMSMQINLPKSWTVSSDMNYRYLTGFSTDYNQSELLWNAEIGKSFMKNNAGTISLLLNDILRQQLSITQVITNNFVEDRQFNTLQSFVMLTFSYKFNTMGR